MDLLIVIDMQKDFITGVLGSNQAREIVNNVADIINNFNGLTFYTMDTHDENYLSTQEGHLLPIPHCIKNTDGWQIIKELPIKNTATIIEKNTFGSLDLPLIIKNKLKNELVNSITLIGVCTDICVISNAFILKAAFPEAKIIIDAACCAGVNRESHNNALNAMKACQISVINE